MSYKRALFGTCISTGVSEVTNDKTDGTVYLKGSCFLVTLVLFNWSYPTPNQNWRGTVLVQSSISQHFKSPSISKIFFTFFHQYVGYIFFNNSINAFIINQIVERIF